ncbi:uncharacterized protein C8orf88 homolog isoform X2 [Bufo gargarizans]|uniref:uncharacterized protein C8orf88 homolog isoform X2 n=1 Tax=Bufo gargarizans TaxID=30331 RepID=UPI001CF484BD|nr:uncharacterized protein C8orf88 homolog isoform X2 [Bufo gargarizans]
MVVSSLYFQTGVTADLAHCRGVLLDGPVWTLPGGQLLLSSEMEVRRLIRKPLQPARPIRRCVPDNGAVLMVNLQARFSDHCRDSVKDRCNLWCSIEKLHVLEDPVTEKLSGKPAVNNKKDRITYSRDFLMQLSNVSVSKQKPKYLPDLPITLHHPISSLHCALDPFVSAHMMNTHPTA